MQLRNHTIVRKHSSSSTAIVDDWRDQSACRDADPETFFPHPTDTRGLAEALDHCAVCPVKAACLEFALATRQEFGVWGGLTETEVRERRGLNRPRGKSCGTDGGWRAHKSHGTEPCQPCTDAHAEWLTQDRRRRLDDEHAAAGGTAYGATLHKRLGEPACPACLAADLDRRQRAAEQSKDWRNQNKGTVNARRAEARRQARETRQISVQPVEGPANVTGACGTNNGYHRHKRRSIPVCTPCADAKTIYEREYKQRKADGIPVTNPRKVSEEQYGEIVRRRGKGETLMSLAGAFGISKTQVRRIIRERTAA